MSWQRGKAGYARSAGDRMCRELGRFSYLQFRRRYYSGPFSADADGGGFGSAVHCAFRISTFSYYSGETSKRRLARPAYVYHQASTSWFMVGIAVFVESHSIRALRK